MQNTSPLFFLNRTRIRKLQKFVLGLNGLDLYSPLNEATGTLARNLAPSALGGNNGAYTGNPPQGQPGFIGNSVTLDATNNRAVDYGNFANYTNKMSIFGIFQLRGGANLSNFPVLFAKAGNGKYFLIMNPSGQMSFNYSSSGGEKSSNVTSTSMSGANLFRWFFLCGTYDKDAGANNLKMYMYSTAKLLEVVSSTQTLAINSNALGISVGRDGSRGYLMNIGAQHVGLVNRALSAIEVARMAKLIGF